MSTDSGFLLINKPSGPTSHDVVDYVRRITGERRVGHAGTLDPFASGLLIIGVGRVATRQLGQFLKLPKRYLATIHLGATSDTYDRTGQIKVVVEGYSFPGRLSQSPTGKEGRGRGGAGRKINITDQTPRERRTPGSGYPEDTTIPSLEAIQSILEKFRGEIEQIPPMYSAKKVGGKKLYELARQGKEIERKPQKVTIHELKLVEYKWPKLVLDIHCSSGTYIRSLSHDIGQSLGVGAYLEELKRTAIGPWKLENALSLEKLDS